MVVYIGSILISSLLLNRRKDDNVGGSVERIVMCNYHSVRNVDWILIFLSGDPGIKCEEEELLATGSGTSGGCSGTFGLCGGGRIG
jgi:hypothetical protein